MTTDGIFDDLVAAARRIDLGSRDPGNSPSIVAGFGPPTAVEATGSVYYRQDAPNAALMLYVRAAGAWWLLLRVRRAEDPDTWAELSVPSAMAAVDLPIEPRDE